jgi:tryptophan synthase beta chain
MKHSRARRYNIVADLPQPPPPSLHPGTHEPIGPEALAHLFPMELIKQAQNPNFET